MWGDDIGRAVPRKRFRHGLCSQRRVLVSFGEGCEGMCGFDWRWILGGGGGGEGPTCSVPDVGVNEMPSAVAVRPIRWIDFPYSLCVQTNLGRRIIDMQFYLE